LEDLLTDVTAFTPTSGEELFIDGLSYSVQNGNRPWSLKSPDDDILRFEVRSGDHWRYDPATRERSEVSGDALYAAGKSVVVSFEFMVEPGQPNTAEWLTVGQLHGADNFTSPVFAVELIGERLAIHLRYKLPGKQYEDWFAFVDDHNIVRGKYYGIRAELETELGKNGSASVWIDGELVIEYSGPVGYGYGVYWKQGIYRAEADEAIAVNYRNHSIDGDIGARILGTTAGERIAPGKVLANNPAQTRAGDVIDARGGFDTVKGSVGPDLIFGGDGDDILIGGRGGDVLFGQGGSDRLKGGSGHDVFRLESGSGRDVVRDFTPGADQVAVDCDYGALEQATQRRKDGTLIVFGGDSMFLKDVLPRELDGGDFLLV
jgi:hypothetical protein